MSKSEFTKKMRNFVKMYENEIPKRAEINFLEDACDCLDRAEARLKVIPDLLEACEKAQWILSTMVKEGMLNADNTVVPKLEVAIAKAVEE